MTVSISDFRPKHVVPVALYDLVKEWATNLDPSWNQVAVRGVSMDSSDLHEGEAFIALRGANVHAATYAVKAVAAGAVAVITDQEGAQLARAAGVNVPLVVVENPRRVASPIAIKAYGNPAAKLKVVGVTGTNGKTTSCFALMYALREAGLQPLILGTVEVRVGELALYPKRTTMEGPVIQRILAMGVEQGCKSAVVEISSHALSLDRLVGMQFDAVGFTNLQQDHLDYYGDMRNYFEAKAMLFSPQFARAGVVCVDDEWGRELAQRASIPVITYSAYDAQADADWVVTERHDILDTATTDFVVRGRDGQEHRLSVGIPGKVNVQNACVAFLMTAKLLNLSSAAVAAGLKKLEVAGRMVVVSTRQEKRPLVIVDFAHTPEALQSLLETVRAFTPGKLIVVFGTDGERDPSKRAGLGVAAAKVADILWVTDENPRHEDPASIRAQILSGVDQVRPGRENVIEVSTCRRDAVREAILSATVEDTVMITGKGNEPYQEINGVKHPYDDREVALVCLDAKFPRQH